MRYILLAFLVALVPFIAAADLGNSHIALLGPMLVDPGETCIFNFWIQNESLDGESIVAFWICFPEDHEVHWDTMGYLDIEQGRPYFNLGSREGCPLWDGVYPPFAPQILQYEGTLAWVTISVPPSFLPGTPMQIEWTIVGDSSGCIEGTAIFYVPVEGSSWGGIKALYR